jgi:Peptidase family M20/M25/M40
MTSKDGYLYGRGTSDNKGPILAMVFAVKELLDRREGEACAGLPCNLSFIFEVCFGAMAPHAGKNHHPVHSQLQKVDRIIFEHMCCNRLSV